MQFFYIMTWIGSFCCESKRSYKRINIKTFHWIGPVVGWFSVSVAVSMSCLCVGVPWQKTCFPVDWRLLVKERIANICILRFWIFVVSMNFSFFPISRFPLTSQFNKINLEGSILGLFFVWLVGWSVRHTQRLSRQEKTFFRPDQNQTDQKKYKTCKEVHNLQKVQKVQKVQISTKKYKSTKSTKGQQVQLVQKYKK